MHRQTELHCPIELLLQLGLLPTTFAMMEARRIEQHRPDLARRIARGEEITVKAQNGELITFSQSATLPPEAAQR